MPGRHRLTITVTVSLYEELCDLAGPRRISEWMEDAAWRKIRARRGEEGSPERTTRGGSVEPALHPGLPPPPWCWSPLRPPAQRGSVEAETDLVDL